MSGSCRSIGRTTGRWSIVLDTASGIAFPLAAVLAAFVVSGVLIAATGVDPVAALRALYEGALGDFHGFSVSIVHMTPLLFTGLAAAIAFRAGVFNVGGEGQLYLGAVFATSLALAAVGLPGWLLVPLAVVAGFVGGAVWALVPAMVRAYRGGSEVVMTLMFNFIAIALTRYMVNPLTGPLGERGAPFSQSPPLPDQAALPILWDRSNVSAALALGVVVAVILFALVRLTPWGFRVRLLGASPRAAAYAGVPTPRLIVSVMLLSGGLAGLAGAGEILGLKHRLFADFSPGYGFEGIAVALLARSNPLGVVLVSAFFGMLHAGSNRMEQTVGLENSIVLVIQALIVLFVIAGNIAGRGPRARARSVPSSEEDPSVGR